jgi:glyoxylase I family protein
MRRLHHVALGALDVERVARFYREVVGLPEVARHDDADGALRSIWLSAGETVLMIERSSEARERVEGVGPGPFLLAFAVTPGERADLERALHAAGAAIESRSEHSSYLRDPEGNRVAISHYPEPAP